MRPAHSAVRALLANSITGGLNQVLAPSRSSHFFLCMRQHAGSIHVLPPAVAYIDSPDFTIGSHQSNSISQAAIATLFASLDVIEDFEWANKQTDINGIVIS